MTSPAPARPTRRPAARSPAPVRRAPAPESPPLETVPRAPCGAATAGCPYRARRSATGAAASSTGTHPPSTADDGHTPGRFRASTGFSTANTSCTTSPRGSTTLRRSGTHAATPRRFRNWSPCSVRRQVSSAGGVPPFRDRTATTVLPDGHSGEPPSVRRSGLTTCSSVTRSYSAASAATDADARRPEPRLRPSPCPAAASRTQRDALVRIIRPFDATPYSASTKSEVFR